jgi:hypothetical protein
MADADNPAASLPSSAASASEKSRGRYPFQVKDWQQRLDRFSRGAGQEAHVEPQDRRREPDAAGIGGVRLTIANTQLADSVRSGAGLLGHQNTLVEKICNLSPLPPERAGDAPFAQDFGELVVDVSWLIR